MINDNKPIIDSRSTVLDGQQGIVNNSPSANTQGATGAGETLTEAHGTSQRGNETGSGKQTSTRESTTISTMIPDVYKASNYDELISQMTERMNEFKPMSEDDLKKLRRRQRAEGIISSISDAAQAVSNLIFTHNYAPNMFDPKEGMTAKAKERFERDKAEREANADKFFNYAMTIAKLKDAERDRGLQMWQTEQTLARQERDFDAALVRADRDAAMDQLRMDLMQGKIDYQEAKTREAQINADYAEGLNKAKINKLNYRPPVGSGSSGGGSGRSGEYPWYDSNGNLHYAHSYEAARQNALNNGTWSEQTQTSTTNRTSANGLNNTTTTTTKPAKGHSAPKKKTNVKWK